MASVVSLVFKLETVVLPLDAFKVLGVDLTSKDVDDVIDKVLSILKRNTSFDTQKDISLD